jgi:hypothetical protein
MSFIQKTPATGPTAPHPGGAPQFGNLWTRVTRLKNKQRDTFSFLCMAVGGDTLEWLGDRLFNYKDVI